MLLQHPKKAWKSAWADAATVFRFYLTDRNLSASTLAVSARRHRGSRVLIAALSARRRGPAWLRDAELILPETSKVPSFLIRILALYSRPSKSITGWRLCHVGLQVAGISAAPLAARRRRQFGHHGGDSAAGRCRRRRRRHHLFERERFPHQPAVVARCGGAVRRDRAWQRR